MNDDFKDLFNNGNDMGDEEFRREFMRLMNKRQKEMEKFLKGFYGSGNTFNPFGFENQNPMNNINPNINDMLNNLRRGNRNDMNDFGNGRDNDIYSLFNKMFGNSNDTEEDGWENKSWTSPDGSMSFYSSSRNINPDDLEDIEKYFPSGGRGKKEDPLITLKRKLDLAIEEERYEEAAKYRDVINTLEEDNSKNSE